MTTIAPPALPLVGEQLTALTEKLGAPLTLRTYGEASVRNFDCGGVELAILIEHERAAAIRYPFACYQVALFQTRTEPRTFRTIDGTSARVLVGDGGWIVASWGCPLRSILALADG